MAGTEKRYTKQKWTCSVNLLKIYITILIISVLEKKRIRYYIVQVNTTQQRSQYVSFRDP